MQLKGWKSQHDPGVRILNTVTLVNLIDLKLQSASFASLSLSRFEALKVVGYFTYLCELKSSDITVTFPEYLNHYDKFVLAH